MIGASSNQLSLVIHWLILGFGIGVLLNTVICSVFEDRVAALVSPCISFVSILLASFALWYWNGSIPDDCVANVQPHQAHFPGTQLCQEAQRSAFTYWEDDYLKVTV